MALIHTLTHARRNAQLRQAVFTGASVKETFYVEDGWVFREHHGKYVECICRTEEMPLPPLGEPPSFQPV